MTAKYRKIYEQQHGHIPKDSEGRSYEIHHIDGNHKNDSSENLKAVTIQEHYNIHYSQGDWAACHRIAAKMKVSSQELSQLSKNINQRRIDNGTHNLLGPDNNNRRVINGTHPLMKRPDGTSHSSDRIKNGTHNFLDKSWQKENARKLITAGIHNFCGENNPNKNMPKVTCPIVVRLVAEMQ